MNLPGLAPFLENGDHGFQCGAPHQGIVHQINLVVFQNIGEGGEFHSHRVLAAGPIDEGAANVAVAEQPVDHRKPQPVPEGGSHRVGGFRDGYHHFS